MDAKQKYTDKYLKKATITKPRAVAEVVWGGRANLDAAIKEDKAWEIDGDVSWKESTKVDRQGGKHTIKGEQSKKLNKEQHKAVSDLLDQMGWNPQLTEGEAKKTEKTSVLPEHVYLTMEEVTQP